jgi:hypothetical protein
MTPGFQNELRGPPVPLSRGRRSVRSLANVRNFTSSGLDVTGEDSRPDNGLSPLSLLASARDFAATALDAHIGGQARRLAMDAGAALEHLAKACLAKRSPALLVEIRQEEPNFRSLLTLLGIPGGAPPNQLRTVGLRNAMNRVRSLIKLQASRADLDMLIDFRDGAVHVASDAAIELRLVATFVQAVDELLADLSLEERDSFWGRHLGVADALLAESSDETAHHVAVLIEAAKARMQDLLAKDPDLWAFRHETENSRNRYTPNTSPEYCPVCDGWGLSVGDDEIVYNPEKPGYGTWLFEAQAFSCRICGLHLNSPAELAAAGIELRKSSEVKIVEKLD